MYIVEHMDPLLPLRPLSAHVKHAVGQLVELKVALADACRLQPTTQYVLIVWEVIFYE